MPPKYLKVSHKDKAVVTYVAQQLDRCDKNKLKIKRGKIFDYLDLGMDIGFELCAGILIVSMIKHLIAVIEEWPKELKGHKVTPCSEHLFKVRPGDERGLLLEEMASQFRCTTVQLFFVCLRARLDVQTAAAFSTTRVLKSTLCT